MSSLTPAAPEKFFKLPDGRTLAYAESGNSSSSTLVIYMHGAFTVGRASDSKTLMEKDVHCISPTLPRMGHIIPTQQRQIVCSRDYIGHDSFNRPPSPTRFESQDIRRWRFLWNGPSANAIWSAIRRFSLRALRCRMHVAGTSFPSALS